MFWILVFLAALALTFVKLGAYFVMTKVLTSALLVATLVIVCLCIALLWRGLVSRRTR